MNILNAFFFVDLSWRRPHVARKQRTTPSLVRGGLEQGRSDAIDEMFDETGIAHGLSDDPLKPIKGPNDFKPFYTTFRQAFPNMTVVIEDMVAEGDKVAARCSVRGKHEGEFLGRAATQSPVEFTGMTIVRIDKGKIVEAWNNFDFMTMYRQVGHLS